MSVGSQVRRFRLQRRSTQREVAHAAGVGAAYLSRVENDRVTPGLRSLDRLAQALDVPLAALLTHVMFEGSDCCPVTPSGRCILDAPAAGPGRPSKDRRERYGPVDLEILRQCNALLQTGDPGAIRALATLLETQLARARDGAGC